MEREPTLHIYVQGSYHPLKLSLPLFLFNKVSLIYSLRLFQYVRFHKLVMLKFIYFWPPVTC